MNWVDIVVGLFMVLFLVAGVRRGFIREVTGLVGLLLAIVLGIAGAKIWAGMFVEDLHFPPSVAIVVSFILIFILVGLLCRAAGSVLFKVVHLTPLGWFDRLGGGIFGLLKGGLIVSLVLLLIGAFPLPQFLSGTLDSSTLTPPMRALAPAIYGLFQTAFPQLRSLGEVVGQSLERGYTHGKEQVLEKSSRVVDMLQKAKTTSDQGANDQDSTRQDEDTAER